MRRSRHLDPIGLTAGLFVAATAVLVPLAFIVEQPLETSIGAATAAWLLALAVLGTLLPAALNYLLLQRVGATRASISMFVMPLFAVAFGAAFLDERLGMGAFVGLALILAASRLVTFVPGPSTVAPRSGATLRP
ncbi:MAG: EamA family transporter [Gammaproteobacteria bacterium]